MTCWSTADFTWFRGHLLDDILPHWLAAAPTANGFFAAGLDREWRPGGDQVATLVSQSRLLFDFATGWSLTGDERYRQAVREGTQFLCEHFRDRRHGGWYWSCRPDGTVVDDYKDTYGHAFVIFGLSHAARCLESGECLATAVDTARLVRERLGDEHGGVFLRADAAFDSFARSDRRSQNPAMHLFEALLALADVSGQGPDRRRAEEGAAFVLGRVVRDDGGLPEDYDSDWRPLPDERGGWINVGHLFEWAFLLSSAVERGYPADWLGPAERMLEYGLRVGYDAERGGICTRAPLHGPPTGAGRAHRGWWEQCEAIRALMHFAVVRCRDDLLGPLARTTGLVRAELIDPEHGGWYSSASAEDKSKGNVWKVDYHVVGMCAEAVRLAALVPLPGPPGEGA